MNRIKQALWLVFALILLVLSRWYFAPPIQVKKLDDKTLSSTVDASAKMLLVRQFDAKGVLIHSLSTPLMEHIPNGNVNIFQTPYISIRQEDEPAWEIHSKKATSYQGGEHIVFVKEVVIHQKPGKNTQESTLKTEEITYYPKLKKASTNLLVTFEQPGNFIQSTGMNAYLDEKKVELLHNARGSYAPAKG
ncbi:MAG: LPS export ABC transporter periplasmic protein LptC [Legionella sp.]|nr:LPS export ABC transporter periplasmic protein LptC [Legionella sp.]